MNRVIINTEMNEYLQPECNVIEVQIAQMIAASEGQTSTETLTEEDFVW